MKSAVFVVGLILIVRGMKVTVSKITKPILELNGTAQKLATEVVTSLKTSVDAIERVNDMIQKTSENASCQADSMEQIKAGIEEISNGIQESSAIAEESSATSQELAAQAITLSDMVQRFELKR